MQTLDRCLRGACLCTEVVTFYYSFLVKRGSINRAKQFPRPLVKPANVYMYILLGSAVTVGNVGHPGLLTPARSIGYVEVCHLTEPA